MPNNRHHSSLTVGFTLIELIISLAILSLLVGIAVPATLTFYRQQTVTAERDTLMSLLTRARTEAMANRAQSAHGFYVGEESFTIYRGGSYAARVTAYDENFPRAEGVVIATSTDINFAALSGDATPSTTIAITQHSKTTNVSINSEGAIY